MLECMRRCVVYAGVYEQVCIVFAGVYEEVCRICWSI